VAILSGGIGSRIQEQREIKPKPMVEIGGARRDPTSSWR
jgi:NDP-sugar pyrophosphorylase family protein